MKQLAFTLAGLSVVTAAMLILVVTNPFGWANWLRIGLVFVYGGAWGCGAMAAFAMARLKRMNEIA